MSRIEDEVCRKLSENYRHARWYSRIRRVMEKRTSEGFDKYGHTLEREDLSESDWLKHAEDEILDAINYLQKLINITADPGRKWYLEELQRSQIHVLYKFETRFSADLIAANK